MQYELVVTVTADTGFKLTVLR